MEIVLHSQHSETIIHINFIICFTSFHNNTKIKEKANSLYQI